MFFTYDTRPDATLASTLIPPTHRYHQRMKERNFHGFEKAIMDNLRVEDVEADGTVVFSLFLGPEFLHVGDTTVKIRCKVASIGQTAVLVRGEIVSEDGKIVYDVVDHNKINVRLKPRAPGSKL
ncbi:hypothetical protein CLAIMM_01992 [Cladophialophora immunda]|nr:hypothetical protein CLAIMM_01992 [Cladophialophora immunda]